jgi:hypothetical protein
MEAPAIYNEAQVVTLPKVSASAAAMVAVEQERALAEVQGAIVLAKRFPRNQIEALDKITVACQRPGLAEQALYSYSRGGTEITGPSIRLAEAIAQNWQNLQFGIRELEQRNGESTVEAFAWDVENNTRHVKTFQVKHERHTKKGSYRLEDPRDIYELTANQGARRLRAAILAIIPGDVIEAAVTQCEQTLKAKADTSPEALKKLVEAFEKFAITKDQIEKRIQRRLDTITPAQLVNLRKIYNSLKDGMSAPADWFEVDEQVDQAKGATGLKDKLRQQKAKGGDTVTAVTTAPEGAPEEYAPGPCPDKPDMTPLKSYCDACEKRPGCPTWG